MTSRLLVLRDLFDSIEIVQSYSKPAVNVAIRQFGTSVSETVDLLQLPLAARQLLGTSVGSRFGDVDWLQNIDDFN